MKGNITLAAVTVLAALTAPVAPAADTRAYAAEPPPSADLRMAYGHPQIAKDNSGITWHWTLTNAGAAGAEGVVATHRISADQKLVGISSPCTGRGDGVVCRFGSIKPGERLTGWIRTSVVKAGGALRVSAQVTWRDGPGVVPGVGHPAAPDARGLGAPPTTDSWGVSDTDATTDIPAQSG